MHDNMSDAADPGTLLRQGQPSRSAQVVATLRAAHQLLDHPPVFADALALPMLGPVEEAALRAHPQHHGEGMIKLLRCAMAVRSRYAEDELAAAVAAGVRQYVVLGAGLDTYGYRPHDPALRVFEVDHPATQAWKRERLAQAGIAVPDTLTFVPLDFERGALDAALAGAGCRLDQPVFFSWLGVTVYLSSDAIFDTLELVARLAPGSAIVFDYAVKPELLPLLEQLAVAHLAGKFAAEGEPWRAFFAPGVLASELRALGFDELRDEDGEALRRRYLDGRGDGLRLGSAMRMMLARVGAGLE